MRLWQWKLGLRRRTAAYLILPAALYLVMLFAGILQAPLEIIWPQAEENSVRIGIDNVFQQNSSGAESKVPFHLNPGRKDSTNIYQIHDFVWIGRQWNLVDESVCMATQSSVDRLFWIPEVLERWQGSMSLAVFAPDIEFALLAEYIQFLYTCFQSVRDNVSIHIVYPISHIPVKSFNIAQHLSNLTCDNPRGYLMSLLRFRTPAFMQWRNTMLYPQNHLRNVARKNCQHDYVFLTDIDIIPRTGLSQQLSDFFAQKAKDCVKCSYVIPTYEMHEDAIFPENKSELLKLVTDKLAQPFHQVVFVHNQFATNITRWQSLPEQGPLAAAYMVANYEFFYEPFYVSTDKVPPHDERFIGYGFTRNSQVYEMVTAGYQLWVLNHAFAMHKGIITQRRKRPSWREKQNSANYKKLNGFKREVAARYTLRKMPWGRQC